MSTSPPRREPIRFAHLSQGFQFLLILILIGSCAGARDQRTGVTYTDHTSQIQNLQRDVQSLAQQVRLLRRDLRGAR